MLGLTRPDQLPFLQRTNENKRQHWQLLLFTYGKKERERRKVESLAPESEPDVNIKDIVYPELPLRSPVSPTSSGNAACSSSTQRSEVSPQCAAEKHTSEM